MAKAKIALNDAGEFRGIEILCPACRYYGGKSLPHVLPVRQIPEGLVASSSSVYSSGDKWDWNGDFNAPTFTPSLNTYTVQHDGTHTNVCHSFIRDGQIQFLGDCTHALAGQTVDLPELDE